VRSVTPETNAGASLLPLAINDPLADASQQNARRRIASFARLAQFPIDPELNAAGCQDRKSGFRLALDGFVTDLKLPISRCQASLTAAGYPPRLCGSWGST
jgi:hypothetical protein